jgi:hypothetical protein
VSHEAAETFAAALLRERIEGVRRLQAPSPAFIHRLRGEDLDRVRLLAPRGNGWSYDVDPVM